MSGIIDMRLMRYINLFEKVSRVSTKNCFVYNGIIIFAVPKKMVSRAVGKNGENVKEIGEILRKKIRVIPFEDENISEFILNIVEPVTFTKVELKDGILTITAGRQNKAALIGRGRMREKELEDILKNYFNIKKLKIA